MIKCFFRWRTIIKMVQFANMVEGKKVRYWNAGRDYLGFARGNIAFVAMGNLEREFFTGLPDGEYCDIISDCQQKIKITDGKGFFSLLDQNEPIVAICSTC